jgi:DNA-binding transcriptional LysR family regulator
VTRISFQDIKCVNSENELLPLTDHDFLEPERLRAFVAVAETGNFTRAAELLHLTQPTVSMQVRRLEENIGRPLFERNAQFVRLTPDGEAMLG